MKKIISFVVLCAVLLSGCSSESDSLQSFLADWHSEAPMQNAPENASDTVLRLTHSSEKGSMLDQTAECFRKKLEMVSGGRLQVEIYPDNTLGKLEKALSFGNGRVDLRLGVIGASYSNIIMWLPLLADVSLKDVETLYQPGSALRGMIDEDAQSSNMRILAVFPMQYRALASTVPVCSRQDLSALKMRVFEIDSSNSLLWSTLCAETIPIEINNVPLSLQLGVIDACDNTLINLRDYGIDKNISDITELPFVMYFDCLCIDESTYDRLNEQQREQVWQAASYAEQEAKASAQLYDQQLRTEMQAQGIRFHTLPAEDLDEIRSEVQPILYEYYCSTYGRDVIDRFISEVRAS